MKNMNQNIESIDRSPGVEIFFGFYSDGKEGGSDGKESSKDAGRDHLSAFPTNPNDVDQIDYQF